MAYRKATTIKCKCGKVVHDRFFDVDGGVVEERYEERERTEIEKKIEARLGIPFRHLEKHRCQYWKKDKLTRRRGNGLID